MDTILPLLKFQRRVAPVSHWERCRWGKEKFPKSTGRLLIATQTEVPGKEKFSLLQKLLERVFLEFDQSRLALTNCCESKFPGESMEDLESNTYQDGEYLRRLIVGDVNQAHSIWNLLTPCCTLLIRLSDTYSLDPNVSELSGLPRPSDIRRSPAKITAALSKADLILVWDWYSEERVIAQAFSHAAVIDKLENAFRKGSLT